MVAWLRGWFAGADTDEVTYQPRYHWHRALLFVAGPSLLFTFAGCAGAPSAHWDGTTALSDGQVQVNGYEAVEALPDLTPRSLARAAGLRDPQEVSEAEATGGADGAQWRVSVAHSQFVTRVSSARECETPVVDEDVAIAQAKALFERMGGDATQQSWFTVAAGRDDARVYAEPNLDGVQTWLTGIFVARVDEAGVCAISGSLMAFEATGDGATFTSPREAFVAVDGGRFSSVEQTYTLGSAGRLAPVWRFSGEDGAAVVADLGDGLESAPDTETYLRTATQQ